MLESLGVKLLDWGISKAANLLFEQTQAQLKQRLNKDDLQMAIALGVAAAKAHELELMAKLDDKQQRQFKQAVFSDSDMQGELQRPFRDEGKPRIEYLIAGFRKVAEETGKPLGENVLKLWLEAFADAYFEKTSALRFDLAKEDYCHQLINYYDELQFLGIDDVDPNEDSKAIELIFVMPDAVAERPPNQEGTNFLGGQAYFDWHETYSFEEEAADLGRQKALIQEQKRINESAEKQWSGAKVSASNLLKQQGKSKRVLLGAPGSGKTTLMSYFTVKLAKESLREDGETPVAAEWALSAGTLPILIRIRDLATKADLTVLEYAAQFAKTTLGCQPLPGGFFERWLQEGKALILLDGLDEVAEDGKRQDIANKIDNFLRQEQFAQNPAIITSRPAGYYRSFFNTTDYPHYLLQSFDDGQIKKFISNWYDQRESSQAEADGCKESLRKALDEQERIKALARNPLLLTIIALIHRWRAELPRDRHELYDRAVNTLIRTWDKKREITSHQVLQYLKLDDLRRLMEQVAYWVHTQGGTGEQQGGTLIDRDELVAKLTKGIQKLKRRERLEFYEAEAEAERFLDYIRDRTGLLNEQGKDRYAFVHKTFQEYLTACEILYRERNQDLGDPETYKPEVVNHIREHLHNAHWREVLLLLVAQQPPKPASRCIKTILQYSDCYEKYLHRNLFFAASCLAEDVEISNAQVVEQILEELVVLEIEAKTPSSIQRQVSKALSSLAATQYEPIALQRLMNVPEGTIEEERLRNYRAELGDRLNTIRECFFILFTNLDPNVRLQAALNLMEQGREIPEILEELPNFFDNSNKSIRDVAVILMSHLGRGKIEVVKKLLTLCKDTDANVRSSAAATLGRLGQTTPEIIEKLLILLADSSTNVCSSAARALGNLGQGRPEVVESLLTLFEAPETDVCSSAAEAVGKLGQGTPEVIEKLLILFANPEPNVRSSAASAVGNLGRGRTEAVESLLALFEDPEPDVRSKAAGVMGNLGQGRPEVMEPLLALLKDPEPDVRFSAAVAVGNLGKGKSEVLELLLALLKDPEPDVRFSAASAVQILGKGRTEAVEPLLALFEDPEPDVRSKAASVVGNLGKGRPEVVEPLLALLKDPEPDVRSSAVGAVGNLERGRTEVVEPLLALFEDPEADVRSKAAGVMGNLGQGRPEVVEPLLALFEDPEPDVRSKAADAVGKLGKPQDSLADAVDEKVLEILISWLEKNPEVEGTADAVNSLWALVAKA